MGSCGRWLVRALVDQERQGRGDSAVVSPVRQPGVDQVQTARDGGVGWGSCLRWLGEMRALMDQERRG